MKSFYATKCSNNDNNNKASIIFAVLIRSCVNETWKTISVKILVPDKKNTTTTEFTMENQWICTSLMVRYVSQRDAHFTWLSYTPAKETLGINRTRTQTHTHWLSARKVSDVLPPSAQSSWRAHCSLWMDWSPGERTHSPPAMCTRHSLQP